jgi:hypothetical protein
MAKQERRWMWVKALTREEKAQITAVCEQFIRDKLKPRFLPEVRPSEFNYPVDIVGKWRGSKYSFVTRYRSGFRDNLGEEFDSAFTRLDHREEHPAETRFDLLWHRHTGQWHCLHALVPLDEALRLIETDKLLQPVI